MICPFCGGTEGAHDPMCGLKQGVAPETNVHQLIARMDLYWNGRNCELPSPLFGEVKDALRRPPSDAELAQAYQQGYDDGVRAANHQRENSMSKVFNTEMVKVPRELRPPITHDELFRLMSQHDADQRRIAELEFALREIADGIPINGKVRGAIVIAREAIEGKSK